MGRLSPVQIVRFAQLQEEAMPYRPKLDPKVDLVGATPETLALALLGKRPQSGARAGGEPVVGDEAPVAEGTPHEAGDDLGHLVPSA